MSVDVTHDPDSSRYTLWLDGERAGFADYLIQGDRIVFTHTEVDPAKRRGGLGGRSGQHPGACPQRNGGSVGEITRQYRHLNVSLVILRPARPWVQPVRKDRSLSSG